MTQSVTASATPTRARGAGLDRDDLGRAYRFCHDITKREARNFYYGLRLTPEPKRSALYALYAWMRLADDTVDAEPDPERQRDNLESFITETEALLQEGEIPESDGRPMWVAFKHTLETYSIDPEAIRAMLVGQASDLQHQHAHETFDELYDYCLQVAGSVGRACIAIWGYDHDDANQLAEWRGVALQLTNILRDFREDYEIGRVYLPQEDFDRFNLTPEALHAWKDPIRCDEFVRFQANRAADYYAESAPLQELIHTDGITTLKAMTSIYRAILTRIQHSPARIVGGKRIRLSALEKSFIALTASWQGYWEQRVNGSR